MKNITKFLISLTALLPFVSCSLYEKPEAYASKEGYAEWFYRGLMTGDTARRRIMSLYADTTMPVAAATSASPIKKVAMVSYLPCP